MEPHNDKIGEHTFIVAVSDGTIHIDLPPAQRYTMRQIADYLQDNGANMPINFYDGRISEKEPYNPVIFTEPPQIIATSSLEEILYFLIPLVQKCNLRHAMQIDGKPATSSQRPKQSNEEKDAILLRYARIQTGKNRR